MNKLLKKSLPKLIESVRIVCNRYIVERDRVNYGKCISCRGAVNQAGHRYPISTHNLMRFRVNNIHGQEVSCNKFKSGNLDEYDKGLINRHGQGYMDKLKHDEKIFKASREKFDRFSVYLVGETFKYLLKNQIWLYSQEEFDKIKIELINKNGKL